MIKIRDTFRVRGRGGGLGRRSCIGIGQGIKLRENTVISSVHCRSGLSDVLRGNRFGMGG